MFLQFVANGLCNGLALVPVALGFGLILYATGVFHLAHGAVYTAAAYTLYLLAVTWGTGMAVGISGALAIAVIVGTAADAAVYQPLARRRGSPATLLIASLGAYTVGVNAI